MFKQEPSKEQIKAVYGKLEAHKAMIVNEAIIAMNNAIKLNYPSRGVCFYLMQGVITYSVTLSKIDQAFLRSEMTKYKNLRVLFPKEMTYLKNKAKKRGNKNLLAWKITDHASRLEYLKKMKNKYLS